MVRAPCCEKMGVKRGPWTPEEDEILISYIHKHGHGNWRALPKQAGLLRCGKSCRLRWTNYLRPDIKRGNFTKEEEETIIKLHEKLGNRWSAIAARLPGRTDNEIKNVWHTNLKKRLKDYQPSQKNKSQSSNMPKSGSKLRKPASSNCTTPVSPDESSSEMSSLTDSSAGNTNSNHPTEIKHEGINSSEHLIQKQFSSEISSTVTCSPSIDGVVKHEEMESSEYFPKIDESFWSEELHMDDSNTRSDFQEITEESSRELLNYSGIDATVTCDESSKLEEDMDFWFNLFIKAGDIPDLS